jgi:hypothetical protein
MLSDANSKAEDAELRSRHVHRGVKVFRHLPCIVSNLPNPNLLHTMQMAVLDHLHKWIFRLSKMHQRFGKYNAIWLLVPVYHDLPRKNKSYEEVSQWNGMKITGMSRYLLGVVTQSL